jgi:hypothetical protein
MARAAVLMSKWFMLAASGTTIMLSGVLVYLGFQITGGKAVKQ